MTFRDLLDDGRPHVFDGAMGTMLYQRGVFVNRCYDELNLERPDLVRGIHRAYVQAGAELLETNSYGANRVKLAQHGLEERTAEINARAAELAAEAAGGRALVGGAIGPLGIRIEPYGPTSAAEAREYFREQAAGLAEGGADFFVLETFSDLLEIRQALEAVRELCDLPVLCQITIQESGSTAYGTAPETCAARLDDWGADGIGVNCSVGPHGVLGVIEDIAAVTGRPLSAQPNAGRPRDVHGRKIYMASPEYMAKYAERLIRAGATLLGGCCGTTPDHIRRVADAVRSASPEPVRVPVAEPEPGDEASEPTPLAERSRWAAKLAAGEPVTSVELLPPEGADPSALLSAARRLERAGIDAAAVPDGPRAQMRMSGLAAATLIERTVGLETVTHYSCRDRNLLGMLSDLLGAQATGLRNLLLVTGDPPRMGPYPEATGVFDIDAIGLTNLVARLNRGLDPGGNPIGRPTSFAIGVAANPGAADRDDELRRLYWKADAGADYAITQPVFDPDRLVEFLEQLDARGIDLPVIAGLWPLRSAGDAEFLAGEVPGVVVPGEVVARMRRAGEKGDEHARAEGLAIAREVLGRIRPRIAGVQVSAPEGDVGRALEVVA